MPFFFMIVDNNDSHLKIVRNIILKSKLLFLILRLTKIIFFCIIMMTNDYHFAKQLIHSFITCDYSQSDNLLFTYTHFFRVKYTDVKHYSSFLISIVDEVV